MIDFILPKELIAQEPTRPRDSARLLVYDRKTKHIKDVIFRDLPDYLPQNTTLVVNNSKVEHCRWLFDDGKAELFVLEKLDQHTIRALVRPGKKFKLGTTTQLTDWLSVENVSADDEGVRTIILNVQHDDERLRAIEHVPLPTYIAQNDTLAQEYQTVYAKPLGSKAAPTAGLHFTDELLGSIAKKHTIEEVTLHVGLETFASLTNDNYTKGTLHEEWYELSEAVAARLQESPHITTVGTTSTRTLESWKKSGKLSGETDIFIQPGYAFKAVDSMITNFHLPGTSLLLMIESFVGSKEET